MAADRQVGTVLALVQGAYYLATGLWPFIHLRSFLAVTGDKVDIWLLETVSVLIVAVGAALLVGGIRRNVTAEVAVLGCLSAAGLMTIDLVYSLRQRISAIYLVDVFPQAFILAGWLYYAAVHWRNRGRV
jgi:hypothetical protein